MIVTEEIIKNFQEMEKTSNDTVSTFVLKLWKMLNHQEATNVMSWSKSGNSFIIQNQALFITKLLPLYFKHNNMGSFIRQLNLYDFHKICVERSTEIEYQHKYFQKDRPDLLKNIRRKIPQNKKTHSKVNCEELANLSSEITAIRKQQDKISTQINVLQQENVTLLKELSSLQAKQNNQNTILKNIVQVLMPFIDLSKNCNKNEGNNGPKIFQVYQNVPQIDVFNKNSFPNWIEPGPNYKKRFSSNQESLQLCALPNDSFVNKNELLDSQSGEKFSKDTLSELDNELSNILNNEILDNSLLNNNDLNQDFNLEAAITNDNFKSKIGF
ncbi:heat shock factor protein 2-like [Tribolium madens]|uniref:heat shock factor protein 2-like n=1 Tax=Tribolium madens TaxID=41895 RepID=UPI001CF763C2|nr:heat shock factor protein 2-like [Tribolium madens]